VADAAAHPLLATFEAAAEGKFPDVDGLVEFTPALAGGRRAVVSFTGHAVLATDQDPALFADLPLDGFGSAVDPAVLLRLAGPHGSVGDLDVILVGHGRGGDGLAPLVGAEDHPRVRRALRLRDDVRVYGDERGVVTLAAGLAGRLELSIEAEPDEHGVRHGRSLLADALGLVPADRPLFAAVSPGNARSLRLFLAAGFIPIGSESLIEPA
jgi:hypothetical protein